MSPDDMPTEPPLIDKLFGGEPVAFDEVVERLASTEAAVIYGLPDILNRLEELERAAQRPSAYAQAAPHRN